MSMSSSSLLCLSLVLAFIAHLRLGAEANRCVQLQGGTQPGLDDVIANGAFVQTLVDLSAAATPPPLYLSVSSGALPSFSFTTIWSSLTTTNKYLPSIVYPPQFPDEVITLTNTSDPQLSYINFTQADGFLGLSGCLVATDQHDVVSMFELVSDQACDSINIYIEKDCLYPPLTVGTDAANAMDDVIFASFTPIPNLVNAAPIPITSTQSLNLYLTALRSAEWPPESPIVIFLSPQSIQNFKTALGSAAVQVSVDGGSSVLYVSTRDNPKPLTLIADADCDSTAMQNSLTAYVSFEIWFGFKLPLTLNFSVSCVANIAQNPNYDLTISLMPSPLGQLDSSFANTIVYSNGKLSGGGWDPASQSVINLGSQQQVVLFNLSYSSQRAYEGQIDAFPVNPGLNPDLATAVLTGLYYDSVEIDRSQPFSWNPSGFMILRINTVCADEGIQLTEVRIENVRTALVNSFFDPVIFQFSWQCLLPKFALSSTGDFNKPDLYANGVPVLYPSHTLNPSLNLIMINLDVYTRSDAIGLQLQSSLNNKTQFIWQTDSATTVNIEDVSLSLRDQIVDSSNYLNYVYSWVPIGAGSVTALGIYRIVCTKAGTVSIGTRLTYGFVDSVRIVWEVQCTGNFLFEQVLLNGGEIFGIILITLFSFFMLVGCWYNYNYKRRRGWSCVPGVDCINRLSSDVQKPVSKRYASSLRNLPQGAGDVEIHSLGYGSYQQSEADEFDHL